jgi:hypothetical protein
MPKPDSEKPSIPWGVLKQSAVWGTGTMRTCANFAGTILPLARAGIGNATLPDSFRNAPSAERPSHRRVENADDAETR